LGRPPIQNPVIVWLEPVAKDAGLLTARVRGICWVNAIRWLAESVTCRVTRLAWRVAVGMVTVTGLPVASEEKTQVTPADWLQLSNCQLNV